MSRLLIPPIESPEVPFVLSIPGGSKVGLIIRIQGNVPMHAHRFQVNLACGSNISWPGMSNLALHFNARFDKGYVARNTLVDEEWGPEEDKNPSHLPLTRGRSFEIMILIEGHQYKVAIDGTHFLEYNHRIPVPLVNTLQILGDIELFKVEFLDSELPPPTLGFQSMEASEYQFQETLNPEVPFLQTIPGRLRPGRMISITGRPKPYATRFSINLERDLDDVCDIIFHFNPRFGGMGDEKTSVVVCNSKLNEEWGVEERNAAIFPFHQGFNFDLTIMCERLDFLVAVNGEHLVSFRHRLPPELVDSLHIQGDLDLVLVRIQ